MLQETFLHYIQIHWIHNCILLLSLLVYSTSQLFVNIIVTFLSPYHKVYWKAVEHIPCLFIYLSLVSVHSFLLLLALFVHFSVLYCHFSIYHIKGKNNNNNNKYKSKILYIKIIKVILNCNNFHNIPVLLYFWSNKCSFGKHKRHFFKTLKNVLTQI